MDPNTKRARDVVWLVVFTVALPSLLLTALGAVAVKNEEAAALARLEALYAPTLKSVTGSFNDVMDEMVVASAVPLRELSMLRSSEGANAEALTRFRSEYAFTTNFYVLDEDGELSLPRTVRLDKDSCLDARSPLASEAVSAVSAQEAPGLAPKCSDLEALMTSDNGRAYTCALQFAATSCHVGLGELSVEAALGDVCTEYAEHPAAELALDLRATHGAHTRVSPERSHDEAARREEVYRKRRALFEALSDPMLPAPAFFTEMLARDAMVTIVPEHNPEYARWRVAFYTLASRPSLLSEVAAATHPWHATARMISAKTEGWRRVQVRRAISGQLAGFELVPPMIEPVLQPVLAELGLGDDLFTMVHSIDLPYKEVFSDPKVLKDESHRITNWAISKKADLSWQIGIVLSQTSAYFSLDRSRSTLYLWALVLMATALMFGLAYTVWAVIREARLSRLKTDFVSSVSHDLRTPLTSIRMFTEMLLMRRVSDEQEERECLEVIAKETERLTRLTERILDFSRMEAGRKAYRYEPISVEPVIQEALEACRPLMTHGDFDVVVEIEPELPRMCADRDAMIEVLMNLISNAVKYSTTEHFIALRAKRKGKDVAISVADHGMGIPKTELKKVFEKFHRVDCRRTSEVSGSGIGLSLVQHIVEAHDGKVDVKSTPGRGSTFTVRIPADGERSREALIERESEASSHVDVEETHGADTGYRGRPIDSPGTV
ncbi:MAG: HAMP domain-containing sensor histidine kinase [Myxococcota bacterium]